MCGERLKLYTAFNRYKTTAKLDMYMKFLCVIKLKPCVNERFTCGF